MHDSIDTQRLHESLILIVDDIELNRKVLEHSLAARGYKRIITAEDGSKALQITHEQKPDLVILDLMMPAMDGFSYCKAIRQDKSFDNMPVIVQTALDAMEQKLRAFELGASDYICKPVDPGELVARTHVHLAQKILMEDLRRYRKQISAELDAARMMQDRLMPDAQQRRMCERVFDIKIGNHFETSSALGGDCWGMHPLSDQRLAVYIFDFSGHGMTAAMNVFRMHTIMQECMHSGGEPGNFLSTINRHLQPLLERDEFATMFYGIIDTDANCLLYASAAVPPAMLFSKREPEPIILQGRGFPLGVIPNATYETKYVPFTKGDLLMLYSDCLIETRDKKGAMLEESHIAEIVAPLLKEKQRNPAQISVDALVQALRVHNPDPIFDDMTLSAFWRNEA